MRLRVLGLLVFLESFKPYVLPLGIYWQVRSSVQCESTFEYWENKTRKDQEIRRWVPFVESSNELALCLSNGLVTRRISWGPFESSFSSLEDSSSMAHNDSISPIPPKGNWIRWNFEWTKIDFVLRWVYRLMSLVLPQWRYRFCGHAEFSSDDKRIWIAVTVLFVSRRVGSSPKFSMCGMSQLTANQSIFCFFSKESFGKQFRPLECIVPYPQRIGRMDCEKRVRVGILGSCWWRWS